MIQETTHRLLGHVKALVLGLLLVALISASIVLAANPANAATTFTVDTTFSGGDANLFDDACDANPLPHVQLCTLTAAIQEANDTPGADTIEFDIPESVDPGVKTIRPSSELPEITEQVTIDGYSQPGSSPNTKPVGNDATLLIELDGTNAGS